MRATNWPVCSVWCSPTGPIRTHSPWPKSLKWGAYPICQRSVPISVCGKSPSGPMPPPCGKPWSKPLRCLSVTALCPPLSDGERQRVFIAKALAQGTPVILLDEPTAFLDFPSKVALMQLLQHLAHHEQKTIILSTHDVELALQFADHLWLLGTEGIVQGAPATLAADGSIARFFSNRRPAIRCCHPSFHRQCITL